MFCERSWGGAPHECAILGAPDFGPCILVWGAGARVRANTCVPERREGQREWERVWSSFCLSSGRLGGLCAVLMGFSLILTVKKKCSTGLKLSNLMNLGRKKSTSLEPPDRSLETSSKNRSRRPLSRHRQRFSVLL